MKSNKISLFHPYVTREMKRAAYIALGQKIITEGSSVKKFEKQLNLTLGTQNLLAVNSGTSALELSYHLLDLKPGDEIITPVFTFAGANVPLIRQGVKIVFADVKDNLSMDWDDAIKKITPQTRAVVNVHLFGQLNETRKLPIPVVGDAAQTLSKTIGERFTAYSFQSVKMMTTVDGGALVCELGKDYERAKLLRWYGIDRETDKDNIDVDIREAGFKYNMSNVTAAIGLSALPLLHKWKAKVQELQNRYREGLKNIPGIKIVGGSPFLIHAENRTKLIKYLASQGIETGLNLRRNDMYTIFGGKRQNLPNMNRLESTYLLLPCRANMSIKEVDYICNAIDSNRK